ncbi:MULTISPECIES: PD-(D/E)XK nuclease family protein [unclassified Carboxylicivirga]|uniref:PDDEXK-like family protein n=1 Tax=Carboxylicivirga TaxID=1628153 RepID=UPI003D335A28
MKIEELKYWRHVFESRYNDIIGLISDCKVIGDNFKKNRINNDDLKFNVFTLISPKYHYENLHSDFIFSFIDPTKKHKENDLYLKLFIDMIDIELVKKEDFRTAKIYREVDNIDISIRDANSKKAIIVENKINNAVDQEKQLPRYYNLLKKEFEIVAIIYLTLDDCKTVNTSDWSKKELDKIKPLIKQIPSYTNLEGKRSLFSNWIQPAIEASKRSENKFILQQYSKLIKFLNTNNMDTASLKLFREKLLEANNLETSMSIKNMMEELPEYLAIRIEEKFINNCYPFEKVERLGTAVYFSGFTFDNIPLLLRVAFGEDPFNCKYLVNFYTEKEKYSMVEQYRDEFKILSTFNPSEGKENDICQYYNFNQELKVIELIETLCIELKNLIE